MLTYADKQEIAIMRVNGFTLQEIADKFGVTRQYILSYLKSLTSDRKRQSRKCVFPGLQSWMVQNNVSITQFYEEIGAWGSYKTLCLHMRGKNEFTLSEIKAVLTYTGLTFDEAFGVVKPMDGGERTCPNTAIGKSPETASPSIP